MANQSPRPELDTAARVRLLRIALGYKRASAWAGKLGVSPQRWNNFETGMPLSREIAIRLVRTVPGLTLDWLYLGKIDGLSWDMAQRLEAARSESGNVTTSAD